MVILPFAHLTIPSGEPLSCNKGKGTKRGARGKSAELPNVVHRADEQNLVDIDVHKVRI